MFTSAQLKHRVILWLFSLPLQWLPVIVAFSLIHSCSLLEIGHKLTVAQISHLPSHVVNSLSETKLSRSRSQNVG